jgi:glycine oxidase
VSPSIAVIGGGAIGLAAAWRLAARGAAVDVYDAGPIPGGRPHAASWASAGFLAPSVDEEPGTRPLDALNRLAGARWPTFAAELREASGLDVALRREGTLVVALAGDDVARLRASYEAHAAAGAAGRWLDAGAVAALEPALAGAVAAARWSGDDVQVDNRLLARALAEAARGAGARLHADTPASLDPAGPAPRVATASGARAYDAVLVAAGAWSGALPGLPRPLPVRPVAGEMVALRTPPGAPPLRHVVLTPDVYLVPRRDGRLLVGATVAERGFDAPVTAGGVRALLDGARRALPAADALPVAELWSGLRPGSPDGAPLLGWLADRVAVAAGHYRNGILQTPVTADATAALLLGEPTPPWLPDFAPDRFDRQGAARPPA